MSLSDFESLFGPSLNIDPIYFIQKYRTIDGEPFRIMGTGREYLADFYRYLCVGMLKEHKPVIVLKGRQVEMTEAALNVGVYLIANYKFFNVLHAFPTQGQVSVFSRERFQGALRNSVKFKNGVPDIEGAPYLAELKANHKNAVDTVQQIEFKNSNFYYLKSAWADADNIRGISSDAVLMDEFQDWTDKAIGNADATMSVSKYKIKFAFGTPKQAGSKFETLWDLSDQRYFHPRCIGCNEYFMITLDNFLTETIVKCPKCGKNQTKKDCNARGKWIPTKISRKEGNVGFHISQLIHPNITREEIERKRIESPMSVFKNEVLGEFYSGGSNPLNPADVIQRCCEPYSDIQFMSQVIPPNETFMGIDWGARSEANEKGANTVVTILSKDRNGYKVEFTTRVMHADYIKQVNYIKDLIRLYNSVSVVADIGAGQIQCQLLQQEYGDRVKSCYYAYNLKMKLDYKPDVWMLTVDRDAFIEEIIDIINRGQFQIPWKNASELDWFIEQICNTQIDLTMRSGNTRRRYEKITKSKPNDALHSLNYAYIASVVHLGEGGIGRDQFSRMHQQDVPMSSNARFSGKPNSELQRIFRNLTSAQSHPRSRNR